jgi:hypothetical protein
LPLLSLDPAIIKPNRFLAKANLIFWAGIISVTGAIRARIQDLPHGLEATASTIMPEAPICAGAIRETLTVSDQQRPARNCHYITCSGNLLD